MNSSVTSPLRSIVLPTPQHKHNDEKTDEYDGSGDGTICCKLLVQIFNPRREQTGGRRETDSGKKL